MTYKTHRQSRNLMTPETQDQIIDLMNYLVGYHRQEVEDAALVASARFATPASEILDLWHNGDITVNQFGQEF